MADASSVEWPIQGDRAVRTIAAMSMIDDAPELRAGDMGEWVTYLQERLEAAGCSPDAIDGEFGAITDEAVRRFQEGNGLTATGVVDAATWALLITGTRGER